MQNTVFGDMQISRLEQKVLNDGLKVTEKDLFATKELSLILVMKIVVIMKSFLIRKLQVYLMMFTIVMETVLNHLLTIPSEQVY